MNNVLQLVLGELPSIIDMIKAHHAEVNPTLSPLSDADALAILMQAINSSLMKDAMWLAAHPEHPV
jgi:hypothetical protein